MTGGPTHSPQRLAFSGSNARSLYQALLASLDRDDQRWVLEVVARQRRAEYDSELSGERFPRALS